MFEHVGGGPPTDLFVSLKRNKQHSHILINTDCTQHRDYLEEGLVWVSVRA
jgi:hypothetical protein